MKEEVKKILQEYMLTDLPLNDATQQVLDLFAAVKKSEQLDDDFRTEFEKGYTKGWAEGFSSGKQDKG